MTARILIAGGYGNFGGVIAGELAADPRIRVIVGGRSAEKARAFTQKLRAANSPEAYGIDLVGSPDDALARTSPDFVIHASGPFQGQSYEVARACIARGTHYVDLADGREFVAGFAVLDSAARAKGVLAVAGASSVPCLTAAIIDAYLPGFRRLESIDYGISTAQRTNRGRATTESVLGYIGRPMPVLRDGRQSVAYGWGDTRRVHYPELGDRLIGDCDIPDLALFPARYPTLRDIRFGAGHELVLLHLATRAMAALVASGILRAPERLAGPLLSLMRLFDPLGSAKSGFHMFLKGEGIDGNPREYRFFLVARQGHGPLIPCIPAILLAQRFAAGALHARGARACVDLIDLDSYLAALSRWDIVAHRDPL